MNDEFKIYNSYSPTKGSRVQTVKKNAIFVHNSNSVKHELCKCVGAMMLHKYGDVRFDKILLSHIERLSECFEVTFKNWEKSPTNFLTEAWSSEGRRVDLVNLSNGACIEFETDKKVDKCKEHNDASTVTIHI